MDNSFELDDSERKEIYKKVIEPAYFLTSLPVESPKAVIVAAQPGAGKTNVVYSAKEEFNESSAVIVNTDDLRSFHPKFKEITKLDDSRSAERTHEDASAWNEMLLDRSIATNRNIILEGVFKDAIKLLGIISKVKNAGYEVEVKFIAAHYRYSTWGIHKRYEKEKTVRGHGRFVPAKYHDECYSKLLNSADMVDEQKLADKVEVFRRDGKLLYQNALSGASWTSKPGTSKSIEKERNRKLTENEQMSYRQLWDSVFEYMKKRDAGRKELEKVRKIAYELLKFNDNT